MPPTARWKSLLLILGCFWLGLALSSLAAAAEAIPHNQSAPPGPALSPQQAIQKMTVPDGFSVELVAAEPNIVNPVAMTIDERGRFWITESLEYPRRDPGPGRDRIKILEDTTGDGRADRITVFADGLNIPSGIAVGHGGVWVANAPDILFYRIGPDGRAAGQPEVIVTGFGRTDTHELPNSLTWGPDGWLYGLNGVFNHCHVKYPESNPNFTPDHPGWKFNCAMFRIHPRTREFQLFCEGTSNPWGIAFDAEGSAFVSACVIDHLWHLVETGYYHRQGGPYPPFTWKIESIVNHKHQKAAYCGLTYFDSDAYPEPYRQRLYMGNIHGGCINVDRLVRRGSTYLAHGEPDFLTANDVWFMPVAQKTGPDGCLYILDWYDRYHCYQDARRDPEGIDRLHGRLYRVRHGKTPRAGRFDLSKQRDDELIGHLHGSNIYFRETAQRVLTERILDSTGADRPLALHARLEQLALDTSAPRKARLHALWARLGGGQVADGFASQLLAHEDPTLRAWGVRHVGDRRGTANQRLVKQVAALAADPSPDVQLQVAIAAMKLLHEIDPLPVLLEVLIHSPTDDELLPRIVWQNLHPLLETRSTEFLALAKRHDLKQTPNLAKIMPRVTERIVAGGSK
jgi:putative membrane-bound dehydrogenase-like protein